jgi:hypothetical protein
MGNRHGSVRLQWRHVSLLCRLARHRPIAPCRCLYLRVPAPSGSAPGRAHQVAGEDFRRAFVHGTETRTDRKTRRSARLGPRSQFPNPKLQYPRKLQSSNFQNRVPQPESALHNPNSAIPRDDRPGVTRFRGAQAASLLAKAAAPSLEHPVSSPPMDGLAVASIEYLASICTPQSPLQQFLCYPIRNPQSKLRNSKK